jgi:thioredoxin 1
MKFLPRSLVALIAGLITFACLYLAPPAWGQGPLPATSRPILYDFGLGRCFSCQQMEKILAALKTRYGSQVDIRLVYVDQDRDLARRYKVVLIPTQVFLDASGQEVFRHMGLFAQDQLVKKLQELKFIKN